MPAVLCEDCRAWLCVASSLEDAQRAFEEHRANCPSDDPTFVPVGASHLTPSDNRPKENQ
jgi:hypothetical protein